MRELILKRLQDLKLKDGFNKDLMRWKNVFIYGIHVSEADLNSLCDEELLNVYDRIMRQYYAQM